MKKMIDQLEILISRFLTGTDSYLFDGHTTINLDNDLIAFNLQELLYSDNQRLINTQTLNLLTYLNNSIVSNKILNDKLKLEDKKHVMIIADEFHLFIDENNFEVLRNFGQLARRIRKYYGSLVVATQSVKDFVGSGQILRHSTISSYENGKTLILTSFAYQIAVKYNISVDWLCNRKKDSYK